MAVLLITGPPGRHTAQKQACVSGDERDLPGGKTGRLLGALPESPAKARARPPELPGGHLLAAAFVSSSAHLPLLFPTRNRTPGTLLSSALDPVLTTGIQKRGLWRLRLSAGPASCTCNGGQALKLVEHEVSSSAKGQLVPVPRLAPCKEALDRRSHLIGGTAIVTMGVTRVLTVPLLSPELTSITCNQEGMCRDGAEGSDRQTAAEGHAGDFQ